MKRLSTLLAVALLCTAPLCAQDEAPPRPGDVPVTVADSVVVVNAGEKLGHFLLLVDAQGDVMRVIRCETIISGDTGNPTDPGVPDGPVDRFGFEARARQWLKNIDADTRTQEARQVATIFRATAANIRGGAYGDEPKIDAIAADVKELNRSSFEPPVLQRWGVGFYQHWDVAIKKAIAAGKVRTKEEFAAVFEEVARGLQ